MLLKRLISTTVVFAVAGLAVYTLPGGTSRHTGVETSKAQPKALQQYDKVQLAKNYGNIPLAFEPNQGQTDSRAKYLSRTANHTLFLTDKGAVLAMNAGKGKVDALHMEFVHANEHPHISGTDKLGGTSNYFTGNDSSRYRTHIPNYAKVSYEQVYPGIDLIFYGNHRQLEYDWVVSPGADPESIRLSIRGAQGMEMDADGNLVLHTEHGDVIQHAPLIYQRVNGQKQPVDGGYVLKGKNQIGFDLASYDANSPVIIDPVLAYSMDLIGSGDDFANDVAVDATGAAYIVGRTNSTNFPNVTSLQAANAGGEDVFITKINPAGNAIVYSTYLGGTSLDRGNGIAVDAAGAVYVTGETSSTDFPTFVPPPNPPIQAGKSGFSDAFVTKINTAGNAIVYSTYLGGGGNDIAHDIAVDGTGAAYITGQTTALAPRYPTKAAFQRLPANGLEAFVSKINALGTALDYSTYLGGSADDIGYGIAIDAQGSAYVTGSTWSVDFHNLSAFQTNNGGQQDVFICKFQPNGSLLIYSTYLGGLKNEIGKAIAVDAQGAAYVMGETRSTNFPVVNPIQAANGGGLRDTFVTKINPAGNAITYSTYLGGVGDDAGTDIALDQAGNAFVVGFAGGGFPLVNPIPSVNAGPFITRVNAAGSAWDYSTFVHATAVTDSGNGVAVDGSGNAYLAGSFGGSGLNTNDAFVAKIAPRPPVPTITLSLGSAPFAFNSTTNNMMTLAATTVASNPATKADVYVALQLPDGTLLVMQPGGGFGTALTPLLSNVPIPDFTGPIFNYTFSGTEPVGNYTWFAALTTPGSLNIIGTLAVAPFSFAP